MIVEAARATGVRVLMQTATTGGTLELTNPDDLPPNVFCIGRCPHDWLLPKVAAVIHHGGAGTVGAGLRLALPTMCCPFFGDQFFYSHAVAATGAGPPPVPFEKLTVANLTDRFSQITHPRFAEAAKAVADKINAENGLEAGLSDFNRQLPLEDMVCDVSTLLHEKELGRHYYPAVRLKVSDEVHFTLRTSHALDQRLIKSARPHISKVWNLGAYVRSPTQGVCTGLLAFIWELVDAVVSIAILPVQGALYNGPAGFVLGIFASLLLMVLRVVYAPIIFVDRVATGIANSEVASRFCCCCCALRGKDGGRRRRIDHFFDPEPALARISQGARGVPMCGPDWGRADAGFADGASRLPLHGPSKAAEGERRAAIEEAFARVVALRRAFDALDASSNDDVLSLSEVGTLSEAVSLRDVAAGSPNASQSAAYPSGLETPTSGTRSPPTGVGGGGVFEIDRLPQLAASIGRYLRAKGKEHLAFTEFVLLCRDHVS